MHTGPQDCDAQVGFNLMLPRGRVYPPRCFISLQIPPRGTRPDLMTFFFPAQLIMWRSFFQLWWYRHFPASFQLVFHENYSTCGYFFFYMFAVGGELHLLLFCRLDSPPLNYIPNRSFFPLRYLFRRLSEMPQKSVRTNIF